MIKTYFPSCGRIEPAALGFGECIATGRRCMVSAGFLSRILRKRACLPLPATLFYLTSPHVQFERFVSVLVSVGAYLNLVTKVAGTPHPAPGVSMVTTRIVPAGETNRGAVKVLPSQPVPVVYGLSRRGAAVAGFTGGVKTTQPSLPGLANISPISRCRIETDVIVRQIGCPPARHTASMIESRAEETKLISASSTCVMLENVARKHYKSEHYLLRSVEYKMSESDIGRPSAGLPQHSTLVHASPLEITGGPVKCERAVSKHFDVSRSEDFTREGSNPRAGLTDINRLADEVYGLIERKIRIERERRGILR